MREEIISYSPAQTRNIGERFAKEILKQKKNKIRKVISLEGELGGGKTTFLKGFARSLGIKEIIKSPTFVIIRKYKLIADNKRKKTQSCKLPVVSYKLRYFYHLDCYRIEKPKEILNLGWRKIIKNPGNVIAVEWGDKITNVLPENYFKISFQFLNKVKRKIKVIKI